eukprot:s341_g4.t1
MIESTSQVSFTLLPLAAFSAGWAQRTLIKGVGPPTQYSTPVWVVESTNSTGPLTMGVLYPRNGNFDGENMGK